MSDAGAEERLIGLLAERTGARRADVVLGIGDDAALLAPPSGRPLALATDTLVAGVHFPENTRPEDVGWKSLAVNLSDLAAMGAEPAWALLALTLPEADPDWVSAFADGFAELAAAHGVSLVGGDTTRGDVTVVTVQVAGFVEPDRFLTRAGAAAGEAIYVTGTLGDAAAGLALLQGALVAADPGDRLRARLDRPTPRVAAGRTLVGLASSAIDLSDGLGPDLARLCRAGGVAARVELTRLPASAALEAAVSPERREALQLAGDDYELCFTLDPARESELREAMAAAGCAVTRIGDIVSGTGVTYLRAGEETAPPARGWRHWVGRGEGDA